MLKSYLKIALRMLKRHKLYTAINVIGLSFGVACCVLILLFIQDEWSFDRFYENKDRIFRVLEIEKKAGGETVLSAYQPVPLAPALRAEFPEVEASVQLVEDHGTVAYGEQVHGEDLIYTNTDFFAVFDFTLLKGDRATALANPTSIVVTERMAQKYFNDIEPLGKRMSISNSGFQHDFIVSGVIANPPANSSIQFDFLLPISKMPYYERKRDNWNNFIGSTFVLLDEKVEASALESKLAPFVNKYFGEMRTRNQEKGFLASGDDTLQLGLQPITAIHLDSSIDMSPEPHSDPKYSYILSGIALLVLLIACINFITLAIGRSSYRLKEVGVRKVLGAVRARLMKQFWGEALLLSALALVLGIVLAELLLPVFNQLALKNLSLDFFSNGAGVLAFVAILLFVGLIAGSYPAAYLSRFQPVEVLKGTLKLGGKNTLTRSLVVFQFGLSIFLIVCALFMAAQQRYLITKNLGYNADQVLVIPSYVGPGGEGEDLLQRFRTALSAFPEILGVTGTSSSFTRGWSINGFEHAGENRSVFVYRVDYDYLKTLGIELKEGRDFKREKGADPREAIIVNEAFVKEFEWEQPVGMRLKGWNKRNLPEGPVVIGMVNDYHFLSLHHEIKPMMLIMDPEWPLGDFLVKISSANIPATIALIEKTWRQVSPNTPFEFSFMDDDVQRQYQSEVRWQSIVTYSSGFAILLACLGLFGLATLSVTGRTKEMGIRKVLGATASSIVALISKEFATLVLLANLIAWPVAWYAMNQWIQDFAYRIDLDWWVFALAGGLTLMIALLTISAQSIKAALANPVDSLRYE